MENESMRTKTYLVMGLIACTAAVIPACSASGGIDKNTEYVLEYKSAGFSDLEYTADYDWKAAMEMQGQPMNADWLFTFLYSIDGKAAGGEKGSLTTVTYENVDAKMIMALGQQKFDTRHINGTSFDMEISPKGCWLSFPEPDQLPRLDMGSMAGGELDLTFLLKYNFPALPDFPVKCMDAWSEMFQRTWIEGSIPVTAEIKATHTYVDVENIEGYDCLKIESTYTAVVDGSADQHGSNWLYQGKLEGTATWYFTLEQGFVVLASYTESTTGTITSQGENAMEVPINQTISIEIELAK